MLRLWQRLLSRDFPSDRQVVLEIYDAGFTSLTDNVSADLFNRILSITYLHSHPKSQEHDTPSMSYALPPVDIQALKGRSVLITGGASGLGRDTAKAFASAGAYVTAADIQNADDLVQEAVPAGQHLQSVHCDVSSWQDQVGAFKQAIQFSASGTIDVVAIFAGVDNTGHLIDQVNSVEVSSDRDPPPPSTISLEVNNKGTFYTTYLALHHFRFQPQGTQPSASHDKSLIIVSSLAGYIDDTHNTQYTASKFGARGIFRAVRQRAYAEMGVRVNLIAPWAIKTPMTEPLLATMSTMGIAEGKGITMAKSETCVEAVGRCAVDSSTSGKSRVIRAISGQSH